MKTMSLPIPHKQRRAVAHTRQLKDAPKIALIVIFGTFVAGFILLPFFWMLKSSFQSASEITASPPIWIPTSPTLAGYEQALNLIPLARYLFNSLVIAVATTGITMAVGSLAAYVLSRYAFPGSTLILVTILFTQLIPDITRVFPIYFLIQDLRLLNTYQGLILAQAGFSVPFAVMMLQAYFRSSYPRELEEAALTDGATWFTAFLHIALPISVPGLVAIGTFVFLNSWNDFLWPSLLLNTGDMKTAQVGIRDFIGEMGSLRRIGAFMAACVMTTLPAIVLFRLIQGRIAQGMSSGALKG